MAARVDTEGSLSGLWAIRLETEYIGLCVLPEVGAKIYELTWKPTGKQVLWTNPRISPCRYPIDGNFDNYWCGGWDECFPTSEPCTHNGDSFPGRGEFRSVQWTVEECGVVGEEAMVRLTAFGPVSPVRAEKVITLLADSPVLSVCSSYTNIGPAPVDFLWGSHPAFAISEASRFRVPAATGIVGQSSDPRVGSAGQRYGWPELHTGEEETDMSRPLPFDAAVACGHYATDLEAGWFAVEDGEGGGVAVTFPLDRCPYLWMRLVYGGWRGYYHATIEPWTSHPVNLDEAAQQGTGRKLDPGETFSVELRAAPFGPNEDWREALARS